MNRFVYAALCDEAVIGGNVDLLFHTMIAGITPQNEGRNWLVTLCTKPGLSEHKAKVVIDATVTTQAGFPLSIPS